MGAHRVYLELLVGENDDFKNQSNHPIFFFATEEVGNFYCKKMSTKKFLQTDEFVERLFFFNVSTSFLNQKQKTLPLRKEQNHNIHTVFCSCFLFSLRESILLQSFHETSLEK